MLSYKRSLNPLSYSSACLYLSNTGWVTSTYMVFSCTTYLFSQMHTHGKVEDCQAGTESQETASGGDVLQCKSLSQCTVCWIAKLRGVDFTLWDRTLGVFPWGETWLRTRRKVGKNGRQRSREGVWSTLEGWHIPEGKNMGVGGCRMKLPADKVRHWTIHQRANQSDLEHKGTCASDADKER